MMKILSTRIPPLRKITKLGKNYLKIGFKYVDNNMCSSILRSAFQQKFKIFLYFGLFLFVYCEWLSYALCPRYWPSLSFTSLTPSQKFFKVLVVADPQILGDRNEKPFSRWDNDRYLSKTFSKALSYTSPDLVVFLGDIMDEGHIAHDEHFNKYLARVRQIFQLDKLAPHQVLFLPGDNDVGGEEDEVSLNKLNRFNNHFNVSYFSVHGGIQFVTVNKLTRTYPSMAGHPNNTMRIVISHLPLLNRASDFGYEIISQLHPSLILSAHDTPLIMLILFINTGSYSFYRSSLNFTPISYYLPTSTHPRTSSGTLKKILLILEVEWKSTPITSTRGNPYGD
uniref:Metallophosphoesterase 1 n=1 Tax=Cacopsylla melanoneura TaxID=428564 RepID=A0A8D8S8Y6_9HEMI